MAGSEEGTMDGETRIKRMVGPSYGTPTRPLPHCENARRSEEDARGSERSEAQRARLIAATVEAVAEGSVARLA